MSKLSKNKILMIILLLISFVIFVNYHNKRSSLSTPQDQELHQQEEQPAEAKAQVVQDPALQKLIEDWANNKRVNYAIYIEEVATNPTSGTLKMAAYNQNEEMVPASTFKIFLAYAVLKAVEQGTIKLDSKANSGLTVENCIDRMIINSDNNCAEVLGPLIGWQNANAALKAVGINSTNLDNYYPDSTVRAGNKTTTAEDTGLFLKKLHNNELLSQEQTDYLLDLMKKQTWRERIADGLPEGVNVASKPGWLNGVQADAGIVYGEKSTYIIVILSEENYTSPLAALSKLVYEYLNQPS